MIIASKGNVRMKGEKSQIMAELVTIADALITEVGITPGMLKLAIDIAVVNIKDEKSNDHRAD